MKYLDLIQKALFEIRSIIKNSSDIRKLVYHDTVDALENNSVSVEDIEDHIVVSPIFDMTKEPFDKSTIISIALNRSSIEEDNALAMSLLKINVLTQSDLWHLNNSLVRPLQISNLIIDLLHNQKLSSSHKMAFINLELAILDENVNGYSLTFQMVEGSGLVNDY